MRRSIFVALAGLVAMATLAAASATAGGGNITYSFTGRLAVTPGSSSTLSVKVRGGNGPAVRKLIGRSRYQSFAVDSSTEYLRWSHGVPTVASESDLQADDIVTVNVRASRGATLEQIESTPANMVGDRGPTAGKPGRPLWLFVGTLNAPASGGHFALHITSGNWLALHAMLGQPLDETFAYDSDTVFILWQGRVPTPISPSQLKVGDRITVRIRAPRRDSLAQAEATPANHVGDHEPGSPS
ncbi:MAG: hypothetical protein WBB74_09135 [Gaiellaceae bacterium]